MSLLDNLRKNVIRKNEEIAKLQQNKAKEQSKIATVAKKINTATEALSKSKSVSTSRSKSQEIERLQREQAQIAKKVADFETKIAQRNKELVNEKNKVSRQETKENKNRILESKKQEKEHLARMKSINNTLVRHDNQHKDTLTTINQMKALPETIVVLFLAANPADQQPLRLDEEARAINGMVRMSKHRDSVKFETRWAVQPVDVLQAINELAPTIVHFSGHGSDNDEIVFQDMHGNTKLVSKEAIVQTMMASSSEIRLVFFNTCYSYNQAQSVTQYVEAAIGMNTSIGDEAAKVFSSQFYSALSFGLSVKKAFEQAKALIMMEGLNEENTPQLFVQEGLDADELIIVKPTSSRAG